MKFYGYYSHITRHYLNKVVTVACGCSPIMLIGMFAMSVRVCVLGGGVIQGRLSNNFVPISSYLLFETFSSGSKFPLSFINPSACGRRRIYGWVV